MKPEEIKNFDDLRRAMAEKAARELAVFACVFVLCIVAVVTLN